VGYKIPLFASIGVSASNDVYVPVMNCEMSINATAEAIAETPFFESGTLSNMAVSVFTNSAGATTNVYFRKNGVDGNMSVSIPAGTTGRFYDLSNTDTVTNGDVCCWRVDRGGAVQFGYIGAYYETDSGVIVNKVGVFGSANFATGTGHMAFIGNPSDAITDGAAAQCPTINVACEAKAMWAYSSSNGRNNTSVFSDRVNAGAGGLSVTFPALTIGLQTVTGTTPIGVNENYNYRRVTNTGSGTFTINMVGVDLHYPANEFQLFAANMGGVSYNATTARYAIPAGSYATGGSLSLSSIKLYGSGKIKDLYLYIPTNGGTVAQIWAAIIGGLVSSLTTTSGISATGLFSDTTNEPTFADGNDLSLRYLKSSGSGATVLRFLTMTVEFDIPPSSFYPICAEF
jgi:hypothetical protein